jgi:hypothetical protein
MQTMDGITILYNPALENNGLLSCLIDSPRHRCACRPSLQLRWKEGGGKNCHCERSVAIANNVCSLCKLARRPGESTIHRGRA